MNANNAAELFQFLETTKDYILLLQIVQKISKRRTLVVKSRIKTGFRGYVCNIISVMNMYRIYIENSNMKFLAVYRLSQDHLEMLFGRIRAMLGSNDNPTAIHLTSALRKLLFNCDVRISGSANISSNVLEVSGHRAYARQLGWERSSSKRFESTR